MYPYVGSTRVVIFLLLEGGDESSRIIVTEYK